jgi:hypothetical protein
MAARARPCEIMDQESQMKPVTISHARVALTAGLVTAAVGGGCGPDPQTERLAYAASRVEWRKAGVPDSAMPTFQQWQRGGAPGVGPARGKIVYDTAMGNTRESSGAGGGGGGGGGGH